MFKYTRTAIEIIISDIKKYCNIFKYGSMLFTVAYFVFVLIMGFGNVYVNSILLTLFFVYIVLDFLTNKNEYKSLKKIVRRGYKWLKFINKSFSLGVMIYSVYMASNNVSGISIILTTLMIVTWVLEILLELIVMIVEDKKDLLVDAFNKDIEDIKKPVTKVNNFIRKIRGEEVIEELNVSKNIRILEKKMNDIK